MLSIPHLVIIFLLALVVLGPEKLPEVARVLGKVMGDFRRITNEFRVQVEDEMRDLERHTREREAAARAATAEQSKIEAMAVTPPAFSDEPPAEPHPVPREVLPPDEPPAYADLAAEPPPAAVPGEEQAAAVAAPSVNTIGAPGSIADAANPDAASVAESHAENNLPEKVADGHSQLA